MKLPAHDGQLMFDKECDGQTLGQDVCLLILSINLGNGDVTLFNILMEVQYLDGYNSYRGWTHEEFG